MLTNKRFQNYYANKIMLINKRFQNYFMTGWHIVLMR